MSPVEVQGTRRETSRHRSAPRFSLPRPVGRVGVVLTPALSLLPPVVLLVVVQVLSPAAQRVPSGAARFDLAGAWLVTEPGALAGSTSWLTAPTLGRLQLGVLLHLLQAGRMASVLAAAHGGMLLLTVLQAVLLWWVLRRLGAGGVAAGLATAVFCIAPIAIDVHTAVSAAAVAVVWLLLAVALVLGRGRGRGRVTLVAAGVAGAIALASAPAVGFAVVPLGVLLVLRLRRRAVAVVAGFGVTVVLVAAVMGIVAALPATAATARLDALVSAQQGAAPGVAALGHWMQVDTFSLLLAVVALVLAATGGKDLPTVVVAVVVVASSVWPLGGDAVTPLVMLLPVVASAVSRSVGVGITALGHPTLLRSVLGSAWLTGVGALLVVAVLAWIGGLSGLVRGSDQPVARVERWIASSVPSGQTILVPLSVWPDLAATRGHVGWFAGGPGRAAVPSSVPWRDADYVVADASLPSVRSGAAFAVLQRSLTIATFGTDSAALSLRAVPQPTAQPTPTPPTTAAGRAAASLRSSAGAQFSRNPRVEMDGEDRARLLAGEVDIRIVLVLAQLATMHRITVRDFAVAAGDASGVRTSVTISEIDGRQVPSDGTKTGVLLRFLSDLRGQLATQSIDANDGGITVRFAPRPDLLPTG